MPNAHDTYTGFAHATRGPGMAPRCLVAGPQFCIATFRGEAKWMRFARSRFNGSFPNDPYQEVSWHWARSRLGIRIGW